MLQAQVRHDRRDDRIAAQQPVLLEVERRERHHCISVDDIAALVDEDESIGVSIERDAQVRAMRLDGCRRLLRVE